jgi:two-component system, OmpR family, phosphate regulon sensor histidine kinase PhoR
MNSRKQQWTIPLMSSSIFLLLVLQLLWLRSAYNDELESFRKETNTLFRSTIISMQDSLLLKGLQPIVSGDSIGGASMDNVSVQVWGSRTMRGDSIRKKPPEEMNRISRFRFIDSTEQIQIHISSAGGNDSLKQTLRPILSEIRRTRQPGNFVFRLTGDSLKVKDIEKVYRDTLQHSGIMLTPTVKRIHPSEWQNTDTKAFHTDPFFLPHTPAYIALFEGTQPALLLKISPQIIFSIILTSLIVTAFVLMYRSIRSQQKLMQLKNDLISNITHELKTPVATVSVALEALKNFNALDNLQLTQEYLSIAQNELGRLTLMTDKILKNAVFEEHGLSVTTESVDLEKILKQVLSSLKLVLEKHPAYVDVAIHGTDFIVNGNREHLTNVIYNLLDNALKYSFTPCSIIITLTKNKEGIKLTIKDNGIGIPYEYQQKIFDKFFRVPTGNVHNAKGYGLGLSYVAGVVQNLGGTIVVNSEPGKGSMFTITLPE